MLPTLVDRRVSRRLVNRGFHAYSRRRMRALAAADPIRVQERQLLGLVRKGAETRFGRDHGLGAVRNVEDFQRRVPLRTYEQLWDDYLKEAYPRLQDVTWPGLIPYFALTSGTTSGATKYIPLSREMLASNRRAARTLVATVMSTNPASRLFEGKLFFLGGSTDLGRPYPGVREGDLSAISVLEISEALRRFSFPPLELALGTDWDRKLEQIAQGSLREPITLISGVPSWLLILFKRLLEISGKSTIGEVWPTLEVVVHGGVKFDPYRESFRRVIGSDRVRLLETYPCSEGFIALEDLASGDGLLRLLFDHGIFYEFVPVEELGAEKPTRHWLGDAQSGVNYAIVVSTCAGMWSHVVGDTVRFERLDPPLLTFTGRTKYALSAFGEHLISEEVEAGMASAAAECGATVREWHVGPVFSGALGHHRFLVEFVERPADLGTFRDALDADLRRRNADYDAHRAEGVGLPAPELIEVLPGGFEGWMRWKGKLGGQHKVPRMDAGGTMTEEMRGTFEGAGSIGRRVGS